MCARPSKTTSLLPSLSEIVQLVREAGDIALLSFCSKRLEVWKKSDGSALTEADLAVNQHLFDSFYRRWPDIAWCSEEQLEDQSQQPLSDIGIGTWVVDPIDGTRGFMQGSAHWGVSVAMVQAQKPRLAVVHCPVTGATYCAQDGGGARLGERRLFVPESSPLQSTLSLACRPDQFPVSARGQFSDLDVTFLERNSIACRLMEVATGAADAAFSRRPCAVWDLAASELIVAEAGGKVSDRFGRGICYDDGDSTVDGFIAASCGLHAKLQSTLN